MSKCFSHHTNRENPLTRFPLSRHWSLEASIGAGYGYRREKKYDTQTETKPERPNYNKWQFLPMKAGLSFIYIIK